MGIDPYSALIKWGGLAVGVLAILVLVFHQGMQWTQREWDAEVAEQQMRTGEFIIKQADNSNVIEQQHQQALRRQVNETQKMAKKVRDYENGSSQKCTLSAEFESVADGFIRVRVPATSSATDPASPASVPHAEDRPAITDVAVLRFIQSAVGQLNQCADQANALIDWVNSSRAIAMEGAGR